MKHTILFLAANPQGTDRLALDEEARAIEDELAASGHRDHFELVTRWAVRPLDLLRHLQKLKPTIVHFSGHGLSQSATKTDTGPDVETAPTNAGYTLYFHGADGNPRAVTGEALAEAFGAAGESVRIVVLSACYSSVQAEALLAHVDGVVGMTAEIGDAASRAFAIGFYGGLGNRQSVANAVKSGGAAIALEGLSDNALPQLRTRTGVVPAQWVIDADPM
jgi:hypothetical protein